MREEGDIKFSTIRTYTNGMGTWYLIVILASIMGMQFMRNFFDVWLKYYAASNPIFMINSLLETLVVILIISVVITLVRAFFFATGNLHAAKNVFNNLLNRVMYSKMQFFETNHIGRILNRFSADTSMVDDRLPFELNILISNTFLVLGSLIIICVQIPYILISNNSFF
jgi:ABC-type multidrug transport system fused ATPase/permease subunit